ncbi:hypothetical protein [Sorangium sp. So ce341]|uniref:hypothetical protein n=1 Tax=Sorangium sp. So ce341 TaxID=3133302 RepID=UPI003F63B489
MSCGYKRDAISLVMSDAARGERVESGIGSRAAADVGVGGAGFAAFATAGASVAFPGLELVVTGPLGSALAGAGSAAGGLVGALAGAGVPEHRARVYENGLRQGEVLVGVHASSERDAEILEMILEVSGAENVRSESAQRRPYDSFI